MRFNSFIFLWYLLLVVLLLVQVPSRWRRNCILLASYLFYATWHPKFLALLVGVAAVNHFGAQWIIAGPPNRKRRGAVIVIANVALLALYKYLDWLVGNVNGLASLFGLSWELPIPKWVLPLGISFYVFEGISYTVDIVRKREKIHSFWDFQLFIAFFPKLIAGPILRAKELLPQIEKPTGSLKLADVQEGLWLLVSGLFLKIVIADAIGLYVDDAFSRKTQVLGALDVWVMAVGFGLQIYLDFSSYSRMAIGSARLCGIQLVDNFNYPYSASSPADFWNRWHMSLSRWIRDYLFFPLVGKQPSIVALSKAALMSMALCGFWHGAGWTFLLWGVYHGVLIAGFHLITASQRKLPPPDPNAIVPLTQRVLNTAKGMIAVGTTFALVSLGWLWFRPATISDSAALWQRAIMPWKYRGRALPGTFYMEVILLMGLVWLSPWVSKVVARWLSPLNGPARPLWRDLSNALVHGIMVGVMLILCLLYHRSQTAFIYFQF